MKKYQIVRYRDDDFRVQCVGWFGVVYDPVGFDGWSFSTQEEAEQWVTKAIESSHPTVVKVVEG